MTDKQEWIVYRENKPYVVKRFNSGQIDYVDLSKWSFLDKFFGFLLGTKFLEWAEGTYPNPRQRKNIPLWFLLSLIIQLRLHLEVAFSRAPGVLRSGSILTRAKFNVGLKGGGFNYRNRKERGSPVDHDTVRKYFRATDAEKLERWYNEEVSGWYRKHWGFMKEGIFILDPTLLPLPPNPHYEQAARIPFERSKSRKDPAQKSDPVKYHLCYQLVLLLHLSSRSDYFLFAASHLGAGDESGLTEGKKLVEEFCRTRGRGVIKLLIVDREYVDGPMITHFKKQHHIDVLIPLKKKMDAFLDAVGISKLQENEWIPYKKKIDKKTSEVLEKEELMDVGEIRSWEGCEVPLYGVLVRSKNKNGTQMWALVSTKKFRSPREVRKLYKLRMQVEERIDQVKNSWLIGKFTSPDFNLNMAQVVFTLLSYSLLQIYLMRKQMADLASKTIETLQREERLGKDAVVVYARGYFGIFDLDEILDMTLSLKGEPKQRLQRWLKKFQMEKIRAP